MLLTDMRNWVAYQLGQDPTATANNLAYVGGTQILEWLKEALMLVCVTGKVWETYKTAGITLATNTESYTRPTADQAGVVLDVIEMLDLRTTIGGESLAKMDFRHRGKVFTTGTAPIYWFDFAERIWISPVPTVAENNLTLDCMMVARPTGELKYTYSTTNDIDGSSAHPLPIPDQYHIALPTWAAAKGKMAQRLFDEASGFVTQFSNLSGIGLSELKAKLGLA